MNFLRLAIKPFARKYVIYTMEEEKYIEEKVGKRNPFRVPEGYFEGFTAHLMEQLPEKSQPRAKSVWLRPWFYAAACACVLLVSATVWLSLPEKEIQQAPVAVVDQYQQEQSDAFEEAADYMMLDNDDIYAYLASE